MKKNLQTFLLFVLIISTTACSGASSHDQQIKLGEKYLAEQNYESALIQFLKIIEIEPMLSRGYTGAAEAYVALGQTDKAIAILEKGLMQLPENIEIVTALEKLNSIAEKNDLAQGVFIDRTGAIEYRYTCIEGVPQPIEVIEVEGETENGEYHTIVDTIMSYGRQIDDNGTWDEWAPMPHYWAGLRCTNCGEDGEEMSDWFKYAFTHAWSGEWKDGVPKIFYVND